MKVMLAILGLAAAAGAARAEVQVRPYGTLSDGRAVEQATLRNANGMVVRIITLGGIVTDIIVPDRNGKMADVALGFGSLADYEAKNRNYGMGAIIGRYAGRIANARFTLDGKEIRLTANDGPNTLHGGGNGLDAQLWSLRTYEEPGASAAELRYTSPEGAQSFPGALSVKVTYRLLDSNALRIDYEAETTAPTVLNLTNHSYFNLAGAGSGSVLDQRLQIFSDRLVAASDAGIPTGAFSDVAGTPFDFRDPHALRRDIKAAGPRGYNHSWFLGAEGDKVRLAARMTDPVSGRTMDVLTSEPSIHAYTAGYFSGEDKGEEGVPYRHFDGLALETQHLADSPNQPNFPSTVLRPGELYRSTTIFRFRVE